MSAVVSLPAGHRVRGMSAEEWDAAASAGAIDGATLDRMAERVRASAREVTMARRHVRAGSLSLEELDRLRAEHRQRVYRFTDAGGVL